MDTLWAWWDGCAKERFVAGGKGVTGQILYEGENKVRPNAVWNYLRSGVIEPDECVERRDNRKAAALPFEKKSHARWRSTRALNVSDSAGCRTAAIGA
jgi:hypothetical protein